MEITVRFCALHRPWLRVQLSCFLVSVLLFFASITVAALTAAGASR